MPSSRGKYKSSDERRAAALEVFSTGIADLSKALQVIGDTELESLYELAAAVAESWRQGGKLLVCGNGGSAADSQHIVAELLGRFLRDRPAFPAMALTTNSSTLTAVANDYGFERVFARMVEGLGQPQDILLTISTSGNSPNCLEAVDAARRVGMPVAAFLGAGGGQLCDMVDIALVAPSKSTPRIQEIHITWGHLLCQVLETWHVEFPELPAGDGDG